jgi:hypothetical protein
MSNFNLTGTVDRSGTPEEKSMITSFRPSTMETIDTALYNWLKEDINISCTTNKGWKPTPIIWVAGERSHQIKNNKNLRDSEGGLIFPMIALQRDNFQKTPNNKGRFYGNIPNVNDPKGGSVTIARRINQEKTANFANADAHRKKSGIIGNAGTPGSQQINFPMPKNKKVVYETITDPMPAYIDVNYTISLRTEYQQQINEMVQPFVTFTGGINYFKIKQDGHQYEAFIQQDFSTEGNVADLGEDARFYETKVTIKVLGYLIGKGNNDEQPKIIKRENAVDVKIPRERVVFGDEVDNPTGKYRS